MKTTLIVLALTAVGLCAPSLSARSWTSADHSLRMRDVGYRGDGLYIANFDETGTASVAFTPWGALNTTFPETTNLKARSHLSKRQGITCSGRRGNQGNMDINNRQLAINADGNSYAKHAWGWTFYGEEASYFCNYQAETLTYGVIIDFHAAVSAQCGQSGYGYDRTTNNDGVRDLAVISRLTRALDQGEWSAIEGKQKLARSIVGLVLLLGTPHKVHTPQALKAEMTQLAKSHRSSKSRWKDTIPDTNALEKLHDRFEEAMLHLSFQILSVYPSPLKQTKSMARALGSSSQREQALAGLDFQIGARETSLPIRTSLLNLCQLPLNPGQIVQVHQWVTHFTDRLRNANIGQNRDQQSTPDGQASRAQLRVDLSVRSSSSGVSSMSPRSNEATQGTSVGSDFVQMPACNDTTCHTDPLNKGVRDIQSTNMKPFPSSETLCSGGTTSRVSGPKLPCFMVDNNLEPNLLIGREDNLRQLREIFQLPEPDINLEAGTTAPRTGLNHLVSIVGMPGVGKSALAAKFAFASKGDFDAIFWIEADNAEKLKTGYQDIGRELNLRNNDEISDPETAKEAVLGWLAKPIKILDQSQDVVVDASWLLIIDNADNPESLKGFLPELWTGSVLVTSRLAARSFRTEVESAELVCKWTNQSHTAQLRRSEKISEILGGFPLGLLQCAELMLKEDYTFTDILQWHKTRTQRGSLVTKLDNVDLSRSNLSPQARCKLGMLWALENLSLQARSVVEVLSFFDPTRIEEAILQQFDVEIPSLADFPHDYHEYLSARKCLASQAYLKVIDCEESNLENLGRQDIKIHREVQDLAQLYLNSSRWNDCLRFVVAILERFYDKDLHGRSHVTTAWGRSNEIFHHLNRVVHIYNEFGKQDEQEPNLALAELLLDVAWKKQERAEIEPIIPFLELAESICKRVEGENGLGVLAKLWHTNGTIGMVTNDAAHVRKYTEQVLDYWEKEAEKTGIYDRNIAVAYNQFAVGLMMSGDIHGAEQKLRSAVDILSRLEDKELASTQKLNLGYNLWLQGRLDEAEECLMDGLAHRETKFGKNDKTSSKTGAYYAALGNVQLARGCIQEARRWHQDALEQYEASQGPKHSRTADLYHIMARYKILDGSRDEAQSLFKKALGVWNRAPKVHRTEIARTTFALAQAVLDPAEKQKLESSAREALKKILGQSDLPSLSTEKDFDEAVMFWSR
ncbi:hypothetical protein GGR51DRAFT_573241 [Nemania sp. FL0031]|nr:hypothetical protein GGR51DRAFT_573241 [Nemania sp. FL0031]